MYGYRKRTLLHKAAQIGDPVVCQLLIDHGADVNKQDARKQTPLWVSAEEGHKDICEVLIQNGASVGKEDASQRTPLWIAAHKKHEDVCKILIDNGAEIFEKDELRIGVHVILMTTLRASEFCTGIIIMVRCLTFLHYFAIN